MFRIKLIIRQKISQRNIDKIADKVAKQAGKGNLWASMGRLFLKVSILAIATMIVLFPFYYMIATSLMSYDEVTDKAQIHLWPQHFEWSNFSKAFEGGYINALWLTALVTFVSIVFKILVTILMGYAFSLPKWRGKKVAWWGLLSIMMLPEVALMGGQFQIVTQLGWRTGMMMFASLSLPFIASVFSALMFRNAFEAIPLRTKEAAMVDGATGMRYFFKIAVPMITPTIWTVGILTAFAAWNSYMWPALLLSGGGSDQQVMSTWLFTTGLPEIAEGGRMRVQVRMAACIIAILPMLIAYFGMRGRIMRAISRQGSAIKG